MNGDGEPTALSRRRCRRLLPPPPPFEMYRRAAVLERRSVELARERQSQRIRRLGTDIAQHLEAIADDEADTRRAA